jgi:hypothetical protein
MGFDFTMPLYIVLAIEVFILTVFFVLGRFLVRKMVGRLKKMHGAKKLTSSIKTKGAKRPAFA